MTEKKTIFGSLLCVLLFSRAGFSADTKEMQFGFHIDKEAISIKTCVLDENLNRRINEIGNRVADASGQPEIEYTFRIINDPTINAYAVPGGFVYVNTGLLDILESEDKLAAILGHGYAHITKSHLIKSIRSAHQKQIIKQALVDATVKVAAQAAAASVPLGPGGSTARKDFAYLAAGTATGAVAYPLSDAMLIAMINGYSREQESEADALAIQYSSKAGYDPNALVKFFTRLTSFRDKLKATEPKYVSSLINAKPGLEERIKQAEKLIPKTQ